MDRRILERETILSMAYASIDRKFFEVSMERDRYIAKLHNLPIEEGSPEEREKLQKEIDYLKTCMDGWQESLDEIDIWRKELRAK